MTLCAPRGSRFGAVQGFFKAVIPFLRAENKLTWRRYTRMTSQPANPHDRYQHPCLARWASSAFGLALATALAIAPAVALVKPRTESVLRDVSVSSRGFTATVVPVSFESVKKDVGEAILADAASLRAAAGDEWTFYVD